MSKPAVTRHAVVEAAAAPALQASPARLGWCADIAARDQMAPQAAPGGLA